MGTKYIGTGINDFESYFAGTVVFRYECDEWRPYYMQYLRTPEVFHDSPIAYVTRICSPLTPLDGTAAIDVPMSDLTDGPDWIIYRVPVGYLTVGGRLARATIEPVERRMTKGTYFSYMRALPVLDEVSKTVLPSMQEALGNSPPNPVSAMHHGNMRSRNQATCSVALGIAAVLTIGNVIAARQMISIAEAKGRSHAATLSFLRARKAKALALSPSIALVRISKHTPVGSRGAAHVLIDGRIVGTTYLSVDGDVVCLLDGRALPPRTTSDVRAAYKSSIKEVVQSILTENVSWKI
jgi:hypothetical protein